jgi:hypothetical protein
MLLLHQQPRLKSIGTSACLLPCGGWLRTAHFHASAVHNVTLISNLRWSLRGRFNVSLDCSCTLPDAVSLPLSTYRVHCFPRDLCKTYWIHNLYKGRFFRTRHMCVKQTLKRRFTSCSILPMWHSCYHSRCHRCE